MMEAGKPAPPRPSAVFRNGFAQSVARRGVRWSLFVALASLCSACAAVNPLLSSGPRPRVEDCVLVQQATPSRFVCPDGKIYTSVQLAEIRKSARSEARPNGG